MAFGMENTAGVREWIMQERLGTMKLRLSTATQVVAGELQPHYSETEEDPGLGWQLFAECQT